MNLLAQLDDIGVWLAAVAGGLAAVGFLARKAWSTARTVDRVAHLLEHELNHNSGKSVKDLTTWTKAAVTRIADHVNVDISDIPDSFKDSD